MILLRLLVFKWEANTSRYVNIYVGPCKRKYTKMRVNINIRGGENTRWLRYLKAKTARSRAGWHPGSLPSISNWNKPFRSTRFSSHVRPKTGPYKPTNPFVVGKVERHRQVSAANSVLINSLLLYRPFLENGDKIQCVAIFIFAVRVFLCPTFPAFLRI